MIEFVVKKSVLGGYTVAYRCPRCNSSLKSPLNDAGKSDTCPDCGTPFLVPGKDELIRIRNAETASARITSTKGTGANKAGGRARRSSKARGVGASGKVAVVIRTTPANNVPAGVFEEIDAVIPDTHRHLLMTGEKAFHFEWMDTTGGCGTTQSAKQFMLITSQRVLYEATIKEGDGINRKAVRMSGSIPLSKISFVGTSSAEAQGCNPQQAHLLKVNSGGGSIDFPFFSEQKAKRVQRVIEELISSQ